MKKIYAVDEKFILDYNGEEITDAEWVERAEELGMIWLSPKSFACELNDCENIAVGLHQVRVIDLTPERESYASYSCPIYFIPTNKAKRGLGEKIIATIATEEGEIYDDFDDMVVAFNNATIPHYYQMQMVVGTMPLEQMRAILGYLDGEKAENIAVYLTRDQIDTLTQLILGESARMRVTQDSIYDKPVNTAIDEYRKRLLNIMNDLNEQL